MTSDTLLVTGAAGFIGARFVDSCNARGIPVVSVDRKEAFESRPEHRRLDFGRILDIEELPGWLEDGRPGVAGIVHMGAVSATTELDEGVLKRLNVDYSKNLWNEARRLGIPFVYASSAAVYGDGSLGFDDDDALVPRLRPLNPYGESKRRFDLWALEEAAAGRTPPAWAGFRFFNVYGFGERHKGPQASVVLHGYDQVKAKGEIRLFRSHRAGVADGHQARDFVDVSDTLEATWFALKRPIAGGIYNVGAGKARTFLDLAKAVFASLGVEERIVFVDTPAGIRERYQYFTEARMDRLRRQGFARKPVALEDGVDWYVRRLESERA
ncbi:MAG TPA: ADP-glyceromanno-heptose 6-epimerase [Thermoanaerobaculia bacterium]|nr:ADP-glyceromanno-heptose 6-epimerase [Thermoanaerobaculia bacterium]